MTDTTLASATFRPHSGGVAKRLVILLHGYGANAQDLIGLAPEFATHFPETAFVSPDAPFPCEMGFGRQWFSLADRSPLTVKAGTAQALPILQDYIDVQKQQWGLAEGDIALLGFSQGTMMALAAAPQREEALGGVIGYSGMLVDPDSLRKVRSRPPILLVHGKMDEVVPFTFLSQAETALRAASIPVETLIRPALGHGIDPEGIAAGIAFLHKIWGRSSV